MASDEHETLPHGSASEAPALSVRRFRLTVLEGPTPGASFDSSGDRCSVGQSPGNGLVLDDPTVSRFHCEIVVGDHGPRVRDLDSLNGVFVDGVQVLDGYLKGGSTLRLGRSLLRFDFSNETNPVRVSPHHAFGLLRGRSVPMRACFALLERAAATDVTVLLEGETGTGKSRAARAVHAASRRAAGHFLTVDCGALPPTLLDSELFGHEKGAFTGAQQKRLGLFEEADGGTVFLDEIGELPVELQPRLLHLLEMREIRRLGSNQHVPVNVRIIAATHRDLRAEVNAGRFRPDLFYRLAVLRVPLPPLRQHPEDLPEIVRDILTGLGAEPALLERLTAPAFLARLAASSWPGNVRELRNYLEQCVVFEDDVAPPTLGPASLATLVDASRPYAEAKRLAQATFERAYLEALLARHDGNVTRAAEAAEIDRVYLHRLIRRRRDGD